ncbi:pyruvate kinase (PK) [Monocercomonoides exilis]|uniref:pyruvate kinase (PK) n=1 Tax=Monocercomonoides exilis TaxID=2049356 RepID=UPI00355A71CF|nr:pyruvate kinase (PK) [Monocercomonoides exilis]|eukprot:MONOS_6933.1-p1 / transcript=MONOS_6933.1 / gene=MONOS_6933 / organism=Monocercomonoides_exilis_PA203 / gene_product=pyruvate kinase (PK) / transcript_product=pyruvate kinase (PK) / location=Mono_scaffold00228:3076-4924(-) / protein_length=597 / sequence_SO=supercontig / SO=protein_coding / is_pseudo=false
MISQNSAMLHQTNTDANEKHGFLKDKSCAYRLDCSADYQLRLTKIFSTLGPSTSTYDEIKEILKAGADVIRMNFSHGTYESHSTLYKNVRNASRDVGKEVAVMIDLQGPKIRCNDFDEGFISLQNGEKVSIIASSENGKQGIITTKFQPMIVHCKVGEPILLDDGYIRLVVSEKKKGELICTIEQGGILKNRKGINLPGTDLADVPALTEKDEADVRYVLSNFDIDYFALSFVRSAEDVRRLKRLIAQCGGHAGVFAKVERPESVGELEAILSETGCEGILYARGDLGVEAGLARVPMLQKHVLSRCCNGGSLGKGMPRGRRVCVCVCTQMLESMIHNLEPTRAECSDVCNAVCDGTDGTMLSGETASGEHPLAAVKMMSSIILESETQLRISKEKRIEFIRENLYSLTSENDCESSSFHSSIAQSEKESSHKLQLAEKERIVRESALELARNAMKSDVSCICLIPVKDEKDESTLMKDSAEEVSTSSSSSSSNPSSSTPVINVAYSSLRTFLMYLASAHLNIPIFFVSSIISECRAMSAYRGIFPIYMEPSSMLLDPIKYVCCLIVAKYPNVRESKALFARIGSDGVEYQKQQEM